MIGRLIMAVAAVAALGAGYGVAWLSWQAGIPDWMTLVALVAALGFALPARQRRA